MALLVGLRGGAPDRRAIDEKNAPWVGGDLVVVQTGDVLDRDGDERARAIALRPGGLIATRLAANRAITAVDETGVGRCELLAEALAAVPAWRMVVGHTVPPSGINSACNEAVWRIDVGMSRHYGGPHQVLEQQRRRPLLYRR